MKYLFRLTLLTISLLAIDLSKDVGAASDTRGERDPVFSEASRARNEMRRGKHSLDHPVTPTHIGESDTLLPSIPVVPNTSSNPGGQQAGQASSPNSNSTAAADSTGQSIRSKLLPADDAAQSVPRLRDNRESAGQISNAPGTTSSSPLGGSANSFGTYGKPIYDGEP